MLITLLNGNPDPADRAFEASLSELGADLEARGHALTVFTLRELKIHGCAGCFGCWLAHPGRCRHRDDHEQLLRSWIGTDLALLASPLRMGFYSALLKTAVDRLLPQLLPYVTLVEGECHHLHRYGGGSRMALLLAPEPSTDDEDLAIVRRIARAQALNMHLDLAAVLLTTPPAVELAETIDRLVSASGAAATAA